jgi:hypothetical protein
MAQLVTSSQQSEITGIFGQHFDLFGAQSNNYINIIKSPVQTIINSGEVVFPGYGADTINLSDISYNPPITGVFPAIIIYPNQMNSNQFAQLKFNIDSNQILIKVQEDCKNFILNGLTQMLIVDGQAYNQENTYKVQNFIGLKYYYFRLTSTK